MKKIIENWVHIPGIHCGSVTLRDVVTYNGYPWSETMCFGIGGGLGFYYTRSDDISPTRMIFMRGPDMEPSFLSLADKPTSWRHGNKNTINIIKESIDRDVPVVIQTDIYYLDYYESSTHFPGHVVSVWGYDDEQEKMYVADNHFEGLKEVDFVAFLEGMGSNERSNPLDYNYIEVNLDKLRGLTELIPEAIRENAGKMLEGVSGGRGESGVDLIKTWAEDLPYWNEAEDWKWCARFGYQVIKKRGVGGAGFRWIYRDFLREAEEMVPSLKSLKLSVEMDSIGEKWSAIAELLKEISVRESTDKDLLCKASDRALEIWGMERGFYKKVLGDIQL
jgi:Butirosin biosynthesis protein H, N-terminal/Domain of unknown function (DUF4872)